MSAFADLEKHIQKRTASTALPPPRTMRLEPGDFAGTYARRPTSDIMVGLRVYSEADCRTAEAEADKQTTPEAANQVLLGIAVARALCDPNDVNAPHPTFPLAEDIVPIALTPRAIKRIFDEVERLHVDQSPGFPEATDEDLVELAGALLPEKPFAALSPIEQKRCRRYVRFVLDALEAVKPVAVAEPGA